MTTTTAPPIIPRALASRLHRLTVEQYETMIREGIFSEDDHVELLDGWIVDQMTKGDQHVLVSLLLDGYLLSSENPVRLATSLPEPDLCILRGAPRDYAGRRIVAHDIALVIEISDTDRADKLRLYADVGIPVYWIINIPDHQIEIHFTPADGRYGESRVFQVGDTIPVTLAGVTAFTLAVGEVLP